MSDMQDPMVARIEAHPDYQALKRKRNGFGWTLTILMLVVYYGFILLIAFADGSATGRLLGVLGGCLVVGLLIAVCLIAVNLSLGRHPDRSDAGGASDFLTVAAGFVGLAALVLGVLLGRPFGAVALGLGLLWLVQFGALLVIALGTRSAARRPRAAARAAAQSERGSRLG